MHLAAATGLGVTAVFGPTDDRATRPLGDAHAVLTHPVWCRPCMLRECPLDHQCMRGIGVAAVLASARRTL
jgi:heptosyltransferase-2